MMETVFDVLRILGFCWLVTAMLVGAVRGAIWFARRNLDARRLAMAGAACGSAWLLVLASWALADGEWWRLGYCLLLAVSASCALVIFRDQRVEPDRNAEDDARASAGSSGAYQPELDLRKIDRHAMLGGVATGVAVAGHGLLAVDRGELGSAAIVVLFGMYLSYHYFREHHRQERMGIDFRIDEGQLICGARHLAIGEVDADALEVRGDKLIVRSAVDSWKDPIKLPIGILTDRSRAQLMAILGGIP